MAIKTAISADKTADRKDRPTPTMRENVRYNTVEAHGVVSPEYTKDQTVRSHEEAKDPEAKAQGAIAWGENGLDNAKRRFQSINKRRQETAAAFEKNRKKSSSI